MFPTNFLLNVLGQINKACDYFLQSFVRCWRKDNVVNLVIVKSVVFNVGRRHLLSPLSHHQHKRPCLSRRCRPGKLFLGRRTSYFGGKTGLSQNLFLHHIFIDGPLFIDRKPIHFGAESPVTIIRPAHCGRSWRRHENMFVLFTSHRSRGDGCGGWRLLATLWSRNQAAAAAATTVKITPRWWSDCTRRGPIPPSSFIVAKYWLTAKTTDFKICTLQRTCVFIQQSFQNFPQRRLVFVVLKCPLACVSHFVLQNSTFLHIEYLGNIAASHGNIV